MPLPAVVLAVVAVAKAAHAAYEWSQKTPVGRATTAAAMTAAAIAVQKQQTSTPELRQEMAKRAGDRLGKDVLLPVIQDFQQYRKHHG